MRLHMMAEPNKVGVITYLYKNIVIHKYYTVEDLKWDALKGVITNL